jgi:hypothetical protein
VIVQCFPIANPNRPTHYLFSAAANQGSLSQRAELQNVDYFNAETYRGEAMEYFYILKVRRCAANNVVRKSAHKYSPRPLLMFVI